MLLDRVDIEYGRLIGKMYATSSESTQLFEQLKH